MAHRRTSFAICYITFKTRIHYKEHMKKGAHLLVPGFACVKGGLVRELMLLHSGHMFVCKGCGKKIQTNNIINRLKKLVCGKPHHRESFANFSIGARTTIDEIILKNVRVGEERKFLTRSRKRAEILHHKVDRNQ